MITLRWTSLTKPEVKQSLSRGAGNLKQWEEFHLPLLSSKSPPPYRNWWENKWSRKPCIHWKSWAVRQECVHPWASPTGYGPDRKPSQPSGRHSSCPCLFSREVASPVDHPQQKASAGLPSRSDEAPQMHWRKTVCWRAERAGWNQAIHRRQFQATQKCYYLSISLTRQARSDR